MFIQLKVVTFRQKSLTSLVRDLTTKTRTHSKSRRSVDMLIARHRRQAPVASNTLGRALFAMDHWLATWSLVNHRITRAVGTRMPLYDLVAPVLWGSRQYANRQVVASLARKSDAIGLLSNGMHRSAA